MQPTWGEAFSQILGLMGSVLFQWVPATVATVAGLGAQPDPSVRTVSMVSSPVSVPDALQYLQVASAPGVWDGLFRGWAIFTSVSIFISLIFVSITFYCLFRIHQIRELEKKTFETAASPEEGRRVSSTQARWNRIIDQVGSDDEQNWRLAILEADILLNELLDLQGYKGETMADKMKQVERADFQTIDDAWEAHRVRNQVAHEGQGMRLDKDEVIKTIGLYQRVFREFEFIG